MRQQNLAWPLATALLLALPAMAGTAAAQDAAEEGSPPPKTAPAAKVAVTSEDAPSEGSEDIQIGAIMPVSRKASDYQFRAGYELHANLISDEYSGNDWISSTSIRADHNITDKDQLTLALGMSQRYLVDPGEGAWSADDGRFGYGRKFKFSVPISQAADSELVVPGKLSAYITLPGRRSAKRSIITQPTGVLTFAPTVWRFMFVSSTFLRGTLADYAETAEGSVSNPMLTTGVWAQVYFQATDWFSPSLAWQSSWVKPFETREGDGQPWRTSYYYEVAANFALPIPQPWPSVDATLAYAQGANVLEDGVPQYYLFKRDQSEIYFGLNVTY